MFRSTRRLRRVALRLLGIAAIAGGGSASAQDAGFQWFGPGCGAGCSSLAQAEAAMRAVDARHSRLTVRTQESGAPGPIRYRYTPPPLDPVPTDWTSWEWNADCCSNGTLFPSELAAIDWKVTTHPSYCPANRFLSMGSWSATETRHGLVTREQADVVIEHVDSGSCTSGEPIRYFAIDWILYRQRSLRCPDPLYGGISENGKCESLSGDFTAVITGVATCGASLTLAGPAQVEPGALIEGVEAKVTDCNDRPLAGTLVRITSTPEARSGFHEHDEPERPAGGFLGEPDQDCGPGPTPGSVECVADQDGRIVLGFAAPKPAGIHKLDARCVSRSCRTPAPITVSVKVEGLVPINTSSNAHFRYVGDTDRHGQSHHLSSEALGPLTLLARDYFLAYGEYLRINDASLPWGGLFDIKSERPWLPPHKEHRCGRAIDVRGNGADGEAVPLSRDSSFKSLAKKHGVEVHPEKLPPHYHLWLLGAARKESRDTVCAQLP